MFEPEYLNLTCPKCHALEVYSDREIGFYCMFCGRQFSAEEIQLLMEAETLRKGEHSVGADGSSGVQ